MKKQDVFEIIIKVFGLYCIWNMLNLLYSLTFGNTTLFFVIDFIVKLLLAYICLYKTDKLMNVLKLKDVVQGE